jgi:hypothetical protein
MKDYIALVTVELQKFARQIAGVRPGRRRALAAFERCRVRAEKHNSAAPLRDRKNAQSRILSGQSCKLFLKAKRLSALSLLFSLFARKSELRTFS